MATKIQHDEDSQAIARQRQLDEGPMPVLERKTTHVLEPGMKCVHAKAAPDDATIWYVMAVRGVWAFVSDRPQKPGELRHDCVKQWFPADLMIPYEGKRTRSTRVIAPPAPDKPIKHAAGKPIAKGTKVAAPRDDIAFKLSQADTLDELWGIAAKLGLPDHKAVRAKLVHLNPGLQRMNIGNRLRALGKK